MNVLTQIYMPLEHYLNRWHLELAEGKAFAKTDSSTLYKVTRRGGGLAVLKHLKDAEHGDETLGGAMMAWYGSDCAAEIYEFDGGAQLMEYLDGPQLLDMYDVIGEEESNDIIASVVLRMHGVRDEPPPAGLQTLESRFNTLHKHAAIFTGKNSENIFVRGSMMAHKLIAAEGKLIPLHGDGHHENILGTSCHAWKVIDPKGIYGAPEYDLANFYCNPSTRSDVIQSEERILTMTRCFASATGYSEDRLLQFGAAHALLSACWSLGSTDLDDAAGRIGVAKRIFAVLDHH